MRLLKLEGEFVGQHKKLGPIYFPKQGVFGILGPTGAGKSTIFSAINIALFGSSPDLKSSEIRNHDAKKNQKWWVELVFEIGGVQYRVLRHEVTAKSILAANGKTIQLGQTDVTEHIVSTVLQMDQTAFLNAFYGKQDEFDSLNKLTNEKRKKEISKLLKLNNIDKSIDALRTDKNILNTQIGEQSRYVYGEEGLNAQLTELKSKFSSQLALKIEEDKKLESKEKDFDVLKKELSSLESKSEQHTELINQHQQISSTIRTLQESVLPNIERQIKETNNQKEQLPALYKQIDSLKELEKKEQFLEQQKTNFEQRQILTHQLEQNKNTLKTKKTEIDNLNENLIVSTEKLAMVDLHQERSKLQEIQTAISSLEKQINETSGELSVVVSKGKDNKEEIQRLKSLGANSTCPTCKQVLGNHLDTLVNVLETREKELLTSYKTINNTKTKLEEQLSLEKTNLQAVNTLIIDLEKQQETIQRAQTELEKKRIEFKELKDRFYALETQIGSIQTSAYNPEELKQVRADLKNLYQTQEKIRSIESSTAKLTDLLKEKETQSKKIDAFSKELVAVKQKGEQLQFDKAHFTRLKEQYNISFGEIREFEKQISIFSNALATTENEIKAMEETIERNKKELTLLQDRKKEFSTLLFLEEAFKNYKIDQLSKLAPAISSIMQNLLSQLTDGKYDLVELDENYNVFVYRGQIRQPLHLFSGGEKKLIALVQRLAISHIIVSKTSKKKFEFLALDEVLGSIDEDRQESILEGLRRLTSLFKQILLVSHNSHINDMFDYTLRVRQDEALNSIIEWDEDWDQEEVIAEIFA